MWNFFSSVKLFRFQKSFFIPVLSFGKKEKHFLSFRVYLVYSKFCYLVIREEVEGRTLTQASIVIS